MQKSPPAHHAAQIESAITSGHAAKSAVVASWCRSSARHCPSRARFRRSSYRMPSPTMKGSARSGRSGGSSEPTGPQTRAICDPLVHDLLLVTQGITIRREYGPKAVGLCHLGDQTFPVLLPRRRSVQGVSPSAEATFFPLANFRRAS